MKAIINFLCFDCRNEETAPVTFDDKAYDVTKLCEMLTEVSQGCIECGSKNFQYTVVETDPNLFDGTDTKIL